jgi:3-hydroxyacyl-CoA dehydrogenase/enoyl-CoA hydratase/3-hydroxybutyryl-CoA epimerase
MLTPENMRLSEVDSGRLTVWFNSAGKSVNLLNNSMWRDLNSLLDSVDRNPSVEQLVFRSDKSNSFLAGADLEELGRLTSLPEINTVMVAAHQVLNRLEQLRIPTVAVITGVCLGGGLEFALVCRYRIATSGVAGMFGLPETQFGLIPGWGGMQRLPERIGVGPAVELLLRGRRIGSDEARSLGMIDAVALPSDIDDRINEVLRSDVASLPLSANVQDSLKLLDETAAKVIGNRPPGPAEEAVIACVRTGLERGRDAGFQAEWNHFGPLLLSPESRDLRRQFFGRARSGKPST